MKNKQIVLAILFAIWYISIFGFIVPTLVSADSDIAAMIGAGLAVVHVVGPILWFNREKKQDVV